MTETSQDQNPIDLIETRLDGGRKWHQGGASAEIGGWRGQDSSVCILGAIWNVANGRCMQTPAELIIQEVVVEQFPDRNENGIDPIPGFNDHPDTVFSDIEDVVLPKARQLYEDRLLSQEAS